MKVNPFAIFSAKCRELRFWAALAVSYSKTFIYLNVFQTTKFARVNILGQIVLNLKMKKIEVLNLYYMLHFFTFWSSKLYASFYFCVYKSST